MPKRRQIVEIFAPTLGVKSNSPTILMDPRSQPDGQNMKIYYGVNQKEYGATLYATGSGSVLGASLPFMYEANFPNGNVLQIFTHTQVYRYTAGLDGFVSDGQVFTGTTDDYWTGVMHNDQFIYSNGINPIQYKASVAATGTMMNSAVTPTTYSAWALQSFREHLNLYHTIENGSEYYKRVRWTKKGQLSPSGTDDFTAGTAGAIDILDCEGGILTAVPLGAGVAIFAERSIHLQFWVGGSEVYRFQKAASGVGTPSRRGAVSYKDVNYFIGHDNFYAYFGGDDVRPIGEGIRKLAFGEINNSALANAFVEIDPKEDEILYHIPTGTNEYPDVVWVFRTADESWSRLRRSLMSYGRFTRVTGLTIGELIGDIGAQNFTFGEAQISAEALTRLYGDQSGYVLKVDPTSYSFVVSGTSTAQTYIYQTPDLAAANSVDPYTGQKVDYTSTTKRWTQLNVEALGNGTAIVEWSTDKGATFTEFPESPITLVTTGTTHTLDLDVSSKLLRVKVSNTGQNEYIGLRYLSLEFLPGSEH